MGIWEQIPLTIVENEVSTRNCSIYRQDDDDVAISCMTFSSRSFTEQVGVSRPEIRDLSVEGAHSGIL